MKEVDLSMVELWVDGKTLRTLCVEVTYFTFGVSVTVSTVKNMGLAKQKKH